MDVILHGGARSVTEALRFHDDSIVFDVPAPARRFLQATVKSAHKGYQHAIRIAETKHLNPVRKLNRAFNGDLHFRQTRSYRLQICYEYAQEGSTHTDFADDDRRSRDDLDECSATVPKQIDSEVAWPVVMRHTDKSQHIFVKADREILIRC